MQEALHCNELGHIFVYFIHSKILWWYKYYADVYFDRNVEFTPKFVLYFQVGVDKLHREGG